MLLGLVGSKSVEKILLFLLVNERCYATQLHRMLATPLTPLQKALERLEREKILRSYYEGKTRLYEFNPDYPLFSELETLLKKAYALLGPQEKKGYYYVRRVASVEKVHQSFLLELWSRMRHIKHVQLEFHSNRELRGVGMGEVTVEDDGKALLTYREKGTWKDKHETEFTFSNCFRWTLNRLENLLTLEHLRHGPTNPVFLFHLTPVRPNAMESLHAHLCEKDTYFGLMILEPTHIRLIWRILGPRKNDEIHYIYSI